MDITKYGVYFLFLYVILPICMCAIYTIYYKKKNFNTVRNFIILKGIAYLYLATAIIFKSHTEKYVTGLTLLIAIFEGFLAIHSAINSKKDDFIPNK